MPRYLFVTIAALIITTCQLYAQEVGINTPNPDRTLDITGSGEQYVRVRSDSDGAAAVGLELTAGNHLFVVPDWRLVNDGASGRFKMSMSYDEFQTSSNDRLVVNYINSVSHVGLGVAAPNSKLHIADGEQVSLFGDGCLMLGPANLANLVFDENEIQARDNGAAATLYIQRYGGYTNIGNGGGNVYMGDVGIGSSIQQARLSITSDEWQLYLRNHADDLNQWFIGASEPGWFAGGDQLVFSPSSFTGDAQLRLMDVGDNDGTVAPFMVHTNSEHVLLMDGNEIDTKAAPLYINHNSQQNTLINPTGGRVGIGTTSPNGTAHIRSTGALSPVTIRNNGLASYWGFTPIGNASSDLLLEWNEVALVTINGNSGHYTALSDVRQKENIRPMPDVLDKVRRIGAYHYTIKGDPAQRADIGVMAQEVGEVFPEVVHVTDDRFGVSYAQLAVLSLKAIQEQQELIRSLEEKIAILKSMKTQHTTGHTRSSNTDLD